MSNRCGERMVGTMKRFISKTFLQEETMWLKAVSQIPVCSRLHCLPWIMAAFQRISSSSSYLIIWPDLLSDRRPNQHVRTIKMVTVQSLRTLLTFRISHLQNFQRYFKNCLSSTGCSSASASRRPLFDQTTVWSPHHRSILAPFVMCYVLRLENFPVALYTHVTIKGTFFRRLCRPKVIWLLLSVPIPYQILRLRLPISLFRTARRNFLHLAYFDVGLPSTTMATSFLYNG